MTNIVGAMKPGGFIDGQRRFSRRWSAYMDPAQLSHVMSEATAPAFVLGAVAGFVAVLFGQMTTVIERIRSLNEIAAEDTARAHLKSDIPRLRQRPNS